MSKRRIELIDILKAVTMFFVIWGHTALNSESPFYRIVIYSFHMPLFFFLAGMSLNAKVLRNWQEWKSFLRRNWLALMVPYFIWGMIYCQSEYPNYPKLLYASWEALNDINTLTSLWFLPCLFTARILVQLTINCLKSMEVRQRNVGLLIIAVIFFVAGRLLPHGEYGWFFCFDVALVASAFILLGIVLKNHILILAQQKAVILVMLFGISAFLFWFGTFRRGNDLAMLDMCRVRYGAAFWVLYNITFGSLLVIIGCMLLHRISREGVHPFRINAITYIGTHTMGIFLLHKPLMQTFVLPFIRSLLPEGTSGVFVGFITTIIILPICCLLCCLIERYIPQLLGQFPMENVSQN